MGFKFAGPGCHKPFTKDMQDPADVGGVSPLVEFVCHDFLGMLSLRICTACCARFGTCVISHMIRVKV